MCPKVTIPFILDVTVEAPAVIVPNPKQIYSETCKAARSNYFGDVLETFFQTHSYSSLYLLTSVKTIAKSLPLPGMEGSWVVFSLIQSQKSGESSREPCASRGS